MNPEEELQQDVAALRRGVDLQLWRRLWSFTKPYRRNVRLLAVFALGTALSDTGLPWVTKLVVDDLTQPDVARPLWLYALLYGVLVLTLSGSVLGFITAGSRVRTGVVHDIRQAGFANLQALSFSYFDRRPVGWLMARMTSDCERLSNILAWGVLDMVWGGTVMTSVTVVMFVVDWRLALTILGVTPVLALVSRVFQRRILASSRRVREQNSKLTAAYNEGIMGLRTTKAFVREDESATEFGALAGAMREVSVRNALQSAVYLPLVLTLGSLAAALVLGVGGGRVLAGVIPLGTLVLFLSFSRLFFEPIQELARLFAEMQMAQASAERVLGLVEAVPEVQDGPEVRARLAAHAGRPLPDGVAPDGLPDRIGEMRFEGVGFTYAGGQRVLHGLDLTVQPGETVALVGATGGGKSTILSLLCRFYEPTEGRILFDGVDYRERSLAWLQQNLGIVLQTPQLFSGTVAENIRYGKLDATDAEVHAAARLVGAEDFVLALEDGYDTQVGEGGGRLSTGQKQLVSFARAVLKAPRILVMDEATSSIDTETEQRIQAGVERVLSGRTSFVIAHRLSTIRRADRILVIDHGAIVESGTHAELMARRGAYHSLYTQQSLREGASYSTVIS
ncbi:MAG: ABC transporter ATP-binding protein [Planctomycetes bacterium]|nr:ABC transporter ATP-binding protein [Planctomycetota bacterium]